VIEDDRTLGQLNQSNCAFAQFSRRQLYCTVSHSTFSA